MDAIKKILGILWLLMAAASAYFCIFVFGVPKLGGNQEDVVFGIIILFVLTPIIVGGLAIFGYYALTGEYGSERK